MTGVISALGRIFDALENQTVVRALIFRFYEQREDLPAGYVDISVATKFAGEVMWL